MRHTPPGLGVPRVGLLELVDAQVESGHVREARSIDCAQHGGGMVSRAPPVQPTAHTAAFGRPADTRTTLTRMTRPRCGMAVVGVAAVPE